MVTLGNYDGPHKINSFVKDLFFAFQLVRPTLHLAFQWLVWFWCPTLIKLNLKNDLLRRRFDSYVPNRVWMSTLNWAKAQNQIRCQEDWGGRLWYFHSETGACLNEDCFRAISLECLHTYNSSTNSLASEFPWNISWYPECCAEI